MITEQAPVVAQFAEDVRQGLSARRKQLPPKYFYDAVGSALFEAICELPEYGLTRADERVLRKSAPELASLLPANLSVAELGSGSGRKTRHILQALASREPVTYYPIEISASALAFCEREMGVIGGVDVAGIEGEYLPGLREVSDRRKRAESLLVLFLGSTIGNFERGEDQRFLRDVSSALQPGDFVLLGTDMVKSVDTMLAAYDDPTGVTAAFNKNVLARMNRELGADFDLKAFEHMAIFNDETSTIEMHLRSKCRQYVSIPSAECMVQFEPGETLWTESSHKYTDQELSQLAAAAGFICQKQWTDSTWIFTESLLKVV